MRITTHGDSLIQLTRWPWLFPVNVYLVREEDGFTLIDTGVWGGAKSILAAARAHGGEIVRIALTHADSDHVLGLDALRAQLPDAEVLMTSRSARRLAGDRSLDPDERGGRVKRLGGGNVQQTTPTGLLRHGDRVGSLEVIASPGHSPDHIAFLDRRDGTLIAGDAFQTRGGMAVSGVIRPTFPFPALATWHKPFALASAGRLRALDPVRLAVGHGDVLDNPLAAMDAAIAEASRGSTTELAGHAG